MTNIKYCLFYEYGGEAKVFSFPNYEGMDITEIDLFTLSYSKEAFLKKFFTNQKIDDIFIGRITDTPKNGIKMRYYECCFQESEKLAEYLKIIAMERLKKVKTKDRHVSIKLDPNSPYFKEFTKILFHNMTSDYDKKNAFVKKLSNMNLKECVLKANKAYEFPYYLERFQKSLTSYKELRMVYFNYFDVIYDRDRDMLGKNSVRLNYDYPSDLFGYFYTFPMKLYEIEKLEKDDIPTLYKEKYQKIEQIKKLPFDSREIEKYYEIGGVEYVFFHMDTNQLYESSKEDLLRLGIISAEEYLEQTKNYHK